MVAVAEQHLRYPQQEPHRLAYDSRSPPPDMMLSESKFFPGHPSAFPPVPPRGLDCGNGFARKDFFSQRKQREFIPENKKDDSYWDRRRRNNEAAKRSREKRRLNDMLLETRVIELTKDNHILKAQLNAIFEKYGIKGENMIEMDVVLSTLPTNDQVLNFTKKRLGPLPPMTPPSPTPSLSFQSLGLPITINNNNNSSSSSNNNHHHHRSCSPDDLSPSRYRSPSPPPFPPGPPMPYHYPDTGPLYRQAPSPHRYEDEPREEKDSGLALNLSADRAGSDGTRDESRSSASNTPPVAQSNMADGGSSGDESGYPRSPHSGESGEHSLPHKLRFKSVVGEKEAVSSLLSLHKMAMIKREPAEHINHWMEAVPHHTFLASLLPPAKFQEEEEPQLKRFKPAVSAVGVPGGGVTGVSGGGVAGGGVSGMPDNLKDEVARLTSEVATLKDILVNRMKETDEEEDE